MWIPWLLASHRGTHPICSPFSSALQLPDNVSMVDAVALATVGIAATQVFTYINGSAATPGATMLVNGGE